MIACKNLAARAHVYGALVVLVLIATFLAGCGEEVTQHSNTGLASLDPYSELTIVNGNGQVTIKTHAQPGLKVEIEKKARAATRERAAELLSKTDVLLSQKKGSTSVQYVAPTVRMGEMVATALTIYVPRDFAGDLWVENGNGDVRTYNLEGDGRLSTGNGDVVVAGWEGELSGQTSNGSITVSDVRLNGNSEFITANGSINLSLTSLSANLVASTLNGSIKVGVPAGTGVRVSASATNGKISITDRNGYKQEKLPVLLNGGGLDMTLSTINGSITVEEK